MLHCPVVQRYVDLIFRSWLTLLADRHQGVSLWMPFQSAAGSVTALMKDCQESQKRIMELSVQLGIQRRNKEMLGWLKKKRGTIRRDELVAFICGKSRSFNRPASSNWTSRHRLPEQIGNNNPGSQSNPLRSPGHHNLTFNCLSLSDTAPPTANENNDLQTFREALALSGKYFIRAIHDYDIAQLPLVIRTPQATMTASNSGSRRSSQKTSSAQFGVNIGSQNASSLAELNAFITEEFTRHVEAKKRSSSSSDVTMSSPTHKKPKYL